PHRTAPAAGRGARGDRRAGRRARRGPPGGLRGPRRDPRRAVRRPAAAAAGPGVARRPPRARPRRPPRAPTAADRGGAPGGGAAGGAGGPDGAVAEPRGRAAASRAGVTAPRGGSARVPVQAPRTSATTASTISCGLISRISPPARSRSSTTPWARLLPTTTDVGTPSSSESLNLTPGETFGRSS